MSNSIGDAINRIVGSQKVIVAAVAGIVNAVVATINPEYDPTAGVMLVANTAFTILIAIQGILDFKWGSQSDGTGAGEG